jgi:Bacterial membrane protein YfhO
MARVGPVRLTLACFALAVLIYYFTPLFVSDASIQWDAVDVHYTSQKYFADSLRAGELPFWTPYVFSGFPFLADPQVGAWYPLNWPFFVLGITPRSIEWETALHCFLALSGAFLLARDLLGSVLPAVFAAVFFAFAGFFAGHTSHTGIFQAASLAPWLLWSGRRAFSNRGWLPAVTITSGCLVLTGHFQTALYSFFALVCLLAVECAGKRRTAAAGLVLASSLAGAGLLPAIMTLPGLELTRGSDRAKADYRREAGATLVPGALLTLVNPNYYGAPEYEHYTGPDDVTQFYFYAGILLLPLAAIGLAAPRVRWYGLALVLAGIWYALGPHGGFYSVVAQLPGFRSVRAPVHIWFVAALGFALLAAGGVSVLRGRWQTPWLAAVLLLFCSSDAWYWNMHRNALAYARQSFASLYGDLQEHFRAVALRSGGGPIQRLWAEFDSSGFGSLNGSLENRLEVTFGYNPLALSRYNRYLESASGNSKLIDSLAVTAKLNNATGFFDPNPGALPRISVPARVISVSNAAEAESRLPSLDPVRESVVEELPAIPNNGPAQVRLIAYLGDAYGATYQAAAPTLLRIATPYFPGWYAEVDGRPQPVVPADLALLGVLVPAGNHELAVHYHANWFVTGAVISAVSWITAMVWLYLAFRRSTRASVESRIASGFKVKVR